MMKFSCIMTSHVKRLGWVWRLTSHVPQEIDIKSPKRLTSNIGCAPTYYTLLATLGDVFARLYIDRGRWENEVSQEAVDKHPHPHTLCWLKGGNEVKVTKRRLVSFSIWQKYFDGSWFDVVPMDACHILGLLPSVCSFGLWSVLPPIPFLWSSSTGKTWFHQYLFLFFVSFLSVLYTYFEPRLYEEACNGPNWVHAMNDDLAVLAKTHTRELVPLPTGKNLIGCRWVYIVKDSFWLIFRAV